LGEEGKSSAVAYEVVVSFKEEFGGKTVEQTQSQAQAQVPAQVSDQEVDSLFVLIDKLKSLGLSPTAVGDDPQLRKALKEQLKVSRASYEDLLSKCRNAVVTYLLQLLNMINYRLDYVTKYEADPALRQVRVSQVRSDLTTVQGFVQEAPSATPQRLAEILDSSVALFNTYSQGRVDSSKLASDLESVLNNLKASVTAEDQRKALDAYVSALQILKDRSALADMLARFFLLMDVVRSETYNTYMSNYRPYIEALVRVLNNQATYGDVEKAVVGAQILMQLKEKGALDVERFYPSGAETPELPYQYTFDAYYQRKLEALNSGNIPAREPRPVVQAAEALAAIDPSRHLWNAIYGGLKSFLPDNVAQYIASGATSSILSAVGTLVPPVGVAIAVTSISDALADIGSRLTNPLDREAFQNFLQEHWQDLLINLAVGVAAGAATSYGVSQIKPQIYNAIASAVEKVSPSLADKIRSVYAPKVAKGTPVYESKDYQIFVDKDTNTALIRMYAGGKVQNVEVTNLKNAQALLADPQTSTMVGEIVGKVRDPAMVGKLLTYLDDAASKLGADGARLVLSELMKMSPEELRGAITFGIKTPAPSTAVVNTGTKIAVITDKGEVATLLTTDIPDNEFSLLYLAEKGNIDTNAFVNALIQARNNPGHYEVFRQGDFVVRADGDVIKLYFGNDIAEIPVNAINPEKLASVANVLSGLKSSLDPTTYNAVLDTLGVKAVLNSPTSVVVSGVAKLGNLFKDVYNDVTKAIVEQYGLKVSAGDLVKLTATAKDGTPVELTLSRQFLTSDQANALIDVFRTRVFEPASVKEALKGLGFREEAVSAIKISESIKYLPSGRATVTDVLNALRNASQAGDAVAVQELTTLLTALNLMEGGQASVVLTAVGSGGSIIAVTGASAGILTAVADALSKGDTAKLQQLLTEAGVREDVASDIAQTATQAVAKTQEVVRVPLTIEVKSPETKEVVTPVSAYESVVNPVAESLSDRVVKIPVIISIPVSEEIIIPAEIYGSEENYLKEDFTDKVVRVPVVVDVPVIEEVVVPVDEYESEENSVTETLTDKVINVSVEVTIPVTEEVTIPSVAYESGENYLKEGFSDKVVRVPVVVEVVVGGEETSVVNAYEVVENPVIEHAVDKVIKIPVEIPVVVEDVGTSAISVYEPVASEGKEVVRGYAIPVPKEVPGTVTIFDVVDVVEGAHVPVTPPSPPAVSATPGAPIIPGGAPATEQPRTPLPRPKGRRELEEISI